MAYKRIDNIRMTNAPILPRPFRNFSGEPSKFNNKGDRNFVVRIDDAELAEKLREDGWNIRSWVPKNDDGEDAEPIYQLQVAVRFNAYPPKVYSVSDGVRFEMSEENIGELDTAYITGADLDIRPYSWERSDGRSGVKAYLQTGYFILRSDKDPFEEKYVPNDVTEVPF